jgi:formamidase
MVLGGVADMTEVLTRYQIYPKAAKAIWDFEGIYCSSRHIPGVRFPGLIHPGILGCAPSAEVLATCEFTAVKTINPFPYQNPQ